MNKIARFRLCTLSDEELINRIDKMTDQMYEKRMIHPRHIPACPNEDYDLLIGELLIRCNERFLKTEKSEQVTKLDGDS